MQIPYTGRWLSGWARDCKGKLLSVFLLGFLAVILSACNKEEATVASSLHKLQLQVPAHFPVPAESESNPLTEEGVELGRLLFYDKRLSGNNQVACATCHSQSLSFSDGEVLSTKGISGEMLHRHSPALINLAWMTSGLFWDGGSTNLESQAFGPLTNEDEMYQNLSELEYELKQVPDYVDRFQKVFGRQIQSVDVVKALAQFERTLVSSNSRYDQYRLGKVASLTEEELHGLELVSTKCQGCHAGELFTDNGFHNNGLDADFSNIELEGLYQGRYRITYDISDLGKFKTPTLRNLVFTAPYMHDGRFSTLDQVLDHYQNGVKNSATTDSLLYQKNGLAGILLTDTERKAILAFLQALSDSSFVKRSDISDPF